MDIEALRTKKISLTNKLSHSEHVLREYIDGRRDEMGLVLEDVKTPAYKSLKSEYQQTFQELRDFNGRYAKILREAN